MLATIRFSRNRIRTTVLVSVAGAFVLTGVAAAGTGKGGGKPDKAPPSVTIKSPSAGATLSGTAAISGSASDNVGVKTIEVAVDGGSYQLASGTAAWSAT